MRGGIVMRYVGLVLLLDALFMGIATVISVADGVDSGFYPLLLSTLMTAALGLFPSIFVSRKSERLSAKETYCIVTGAWLVSCVVGMFPYLMWGGSFTIENAWFESVSGFTTTGSTILSTVEELPKGLLFWRSATHWIGGLGVVLFTLTLMSSANRTRMTISSVELSTLARDNYKYHTHTIIRILLLTYTVLTLAESVALRIAGMDWFDAVCHSFSTIATGGFSTRTASIAAYNSIAIESVISFFSLLAGIHFGLIFATIIGRRNNIFRSEVCRYWFACIGIGALAIALNLVVTNVYPDFWGALRVSLFQSVSVITTTGFATADPNMWSPLAMAILVFFIIQGACAGSTSGGLKSDRVLLAFKVIRHNIRQQQHPNAVLRIRLNGIMQNERVVHFAMFYIVIYFLVVVGGTIINAGAGCDYTTAFTSSLASMSNVGPGFGSVGLMDSYAAMPLLAKLDCTLLMLLGRLEVFGLIQLFLLKWWV